MIAFLQTTMVVAILSLGIIYGSEANQADIDAKNMLWKYRSELSEIADEIELGNLYEFIGDEDPDQALATLRETRESLSPEEI